MKTGQFIVDELEVLPDEARREAMDFVVFLRQRYGRVREQVREKKPSLKREPFLGIWADRSDMEDSVEWIRARRRREWPG